MDVARAASLLLDARAGNTPIVGLPEACRPASVEDGYAIQDAVTARIGLTVNGRKIGCTAVDSQRFLGVDGPFLGRMFAETSHISGVTLPGSAFAMRGIEGEFAFRLGRDFPPRPTPYSRDEVGAGATLHPAIEIVCTRYVDWLKVGAPSIVADNGAHAAFIEGAAVQDWHTLDLANHRMVLTVDGKQIAEGLGSAVLGHPLDALVFAVNASAQRGHPLKAGDAVSTGTCVGFHPVGPSAHVVVDLGPLGRAELKFSD
jgi:2-keto-4-pentenoate hydratase